MRMVMMFGFYVASFLRNETVENPPSVRNIRLKWQVDQKIFKAKVASIKF